MIPCCTCVVFWAQQPNTTVLLRTLSCDSLESRESHGTFGSLLRYIPSFWAPYPAVALLPRLVVSQPPSPLLSSHRGSACFSCVLWTSSCRWLFSGFFEPSSSVGLTGFLGPYPVCVRLQLLGPFPVCVSSCCTTRCLLRLC